MATLMNKSTVTNPYKAILLSCHYIITKKEKMTGINCSGRYV
jgi:hypothetical protein